MKIPGKHHPVPKVGDTVVLNDYGLKIIGGGHSYMKTLRMKVTAIESESITQPEVTYLMRVSDREIDHAMLFHTMFDIVERA